MKSIATKHEPIFHISKRNDITGLKSILLHLISVFIALLIGGIIVVIMSDVKNPFSIYIEMFKGTFMSSTKWVDSIHSTTVLLIISLAVTPAFKMKFWNIGAEGQVMVGGLAAAFCMINLGPILAEPILLIVMFATSILAGMIWALIPAFFKSFWNTNETLFTLMMNYVATTLISYFLKVYDPSGRATSIYINERTQYGYLPKVFGHDYLLNIIIIVFVMFMMYFYLKSTKQGYEISVVGESPKTAKYVGINVKKVILRTMAISGAVCGLAGLLMIAGTSAPTISSDFVENQGFTSVLVSWMSSFNPFIMIVVCALIVLLRDGGSAATNLYKIDSNIGMVIMAIVIFSIIICHFFTQYRVSIRKPKKGDK